MDRGYQHFDGDRTGLGGSMRSVWIQSVQRVLGIRRRARSKIVPVLTAFLAYVVAIAFVGGVILADNFLEDMMVNEGINPSAFVPEYGDFYLFITLAILLFGAFSGPEILCPDRRTGMLGLYLASPLRRDSYLVTKALAVGSVLMIVTFGPPLLLLLGYTAGGYGPDGPIDWMIVLGRMVVAGIAVAALHTSLSMAVSSVTTRHALATAGFIVIILLTSSLTEILVESANAPDFVALGNLFLLPFEFVLRIFGEHADPEDANMLSNFSTLEIALANIGWTLAFATFVRQRYQRLDVTK